MDECQVYLHESNSSGQRRLKDNEEHWRSVEQRKEDDDGLSGHCHPHQFAVGHKKGEFPDGHRPLSSVHLVHLSFDMFTSISSVTFLFPRFFRHFDCRMLHVKRHIPKGDLNQSMITFATVFGVRLFVRNPNSTHLPVVCGHFSGLLSDE
jgi:hypothetical protein